MTAVTANQHYTPEDVIRLEMDELYELVDGHLIEKIMSELANETAVFTGAALLNHVRQGNLGRVMAEQSFRCFPRDPNLVRRPDVAFMLATRLPAPDIAVEVVSPADRFYDLDEKLNDYRLAGVKLAWVVNSELRTLLIYRADGTIKRLFDYDMLSGETVLPNFALKVADLIPQIGQVSQPG